MFRFIHTADWQIGKVFGGFPAEKQGVLRDARLSAVDRIAEAARTHGAALVLVAGDVYDSETLPAREIAHLIERLKAHGGLVWFLLPGNHDPDRPGGLYERLARASLPDNVRLCRKPEVISPAAGVSILPAPLRSRTESGDPTAWMDTAATPPDTLRIGLAHGSVQGFGSSSESAARIAPDRARTAGLAYLALGDWHGTKEVAATTWYAGTPEPDRYLGNASGQVLAVTLGDGRTGLLVEPIATGRFTWLGARLSPRSVADIDAFGRDLAGASGTLDRLLVRLEVRGAASVQARGEILTRLSGIADRLFHFELDREAFAVLPGADDLTGLGIATHLETVARRLLAMRETMPGDDTRTADRALDILFRLAVGGRQ